MLAVRVLHLSAHPELLLDEVRRVTAPNGSLVVSYHPRGSLKLLQYRLWRALRSPRGSPYGRDREAREGRGGPPPNLLSRRSLQRMLESRGFALEESIGTGFEELTALNRLPPQFFLGLTRTVPDAWGYPTRFARFRLR